MKNGTSQPTLESVAFYREPVDAGIDENSGTGILTVTPHPEGTWEKIKAIIEQSLPS